MGHLDTLTVQVCELARQAGKEIMRFYGAGAGVTWKKDASPLTLADSASHDFLVKSLQSLMPEATVISEESDEATEGAIDAAKSFWLVDPLDGTKEFLKGTNEFTVNVALIEAGSPVLGVIHAPALSLTYYGARNLGSWRQAGDLPATRISTRPAGPSHLAVVASKDHAGPLVGAMLERLASPQLQSMGSSLKFCLVAEGKADVYLRDLPTMEWDTAAAQCIVEAAGGGLYSLDTKPLRYAKPGLKNPAIMTVGDVHFDWLPLVLPNGNKTV
ncbi:MAG TPA: 3'(2'),5'-bisphosphate nucleotidase CysQ [Terriglobales bacterium]|nr:3'(2'),5'-bisphosphate nucleotidase CysQ [Terriglobales bacterium]